MKEQEVWHGPSHYQIKVKGQLFGSQWSNWFNSMTIESKEGVTNITGKVEDSATLDELLVRVRNLGLIQVSIERIESEQNKIT